MSLKKDRNRKSGIELPFGASLWKKLGPYHAWIYGGAGLFLFVIISLGLWVSYLEKMDSRAWKQLGEKPDSIAMEEVIANFPHSTAARMAILFLADDAWKTGNYQKAVKNYELLEADAGMKDFRELVLNRKAECFVMLKRFDKAQSIFQELKKGSLISTLSYIQDARILWLMGKPDQARDLLKQTKAASGFGTWNEEADALERYLSVS